MPPQPFPPRPCWNLRTRDRQGTISASASRGASRPEIEKEDDADGDLDMDPAQEATDNSPERSQTSPLTRATLLIAGVFTVGYCGVGQVVSSH